MYSTKNLMLPFSSIFSLLSEAKRMEYHSPVICNKSIKWLGEKRGKEYNMNPCLLERWPLGQDSHDGDVKTKLDLGWSALYLGLFPLLTVPPVSWRFPKGCHLLTWHHCPFLDQGLKPPISSTMSRASSPPREPLCFRIFQNTLQNPKSLCSTALEWVWGFPHSSAGKESACNLLPCPYLWNIEVASHNIRVSLLGTD